MTIVVRMTEDEFLTFIEEAVPAYAADKVEIGRAHV